MFFDPKTAARYAREDLRFLFPAEEVILEELKRDGLREMRMLDMGVGGGRTTPYFQPLVREYIGVDYSPAMIDICAQRFPGGIPNGGFTWGDARDLRQFAPASFDFVLFSFNGIDCANPEDREVVLREIRRVLKEDALFCFSSHNIDWEGLVPMLDIRSVAQHIRTPKAFIKQFLRQCRMRLENRSLNLKRKVEEMRKRGFGCIYESPPRQYYTTVQYAVAQLHRTGFDRVRIFSGNGIESTDPAELNDNYQVYYLARAAPVSS